MNMMNDINSQRDSIIAAENELAAEELEHIENQAQVAAAMLDDAARLIKLIEDTAVDLVGDYLGLAENSDEGADDYPVDFDEFPQYLPPVPPVSRVDKRIGRRRTYDHPFVPEENQRPFKGAFETSSKPRVSNSRLRVPSYKRPPPIREPFQMFGGKYSTPLYNDRNRPIGIFPNEDFTRPRFRRNQGYSASDALLDNLLKSKRSSAREYEALPLIADDIPSDDPNIWEMLAKESPRIFPIDDNIMGRMGPNGHPYIDGVFTPYTKSREESLDKLWPLVNNHADRDVPLDEGLEQAYEAAALMQEKMNRENQRNEEQVSW